MSNKDPYTISVFPDSVLATLPDPGPKQVAFERWRQIDDTLDELVAMGVPAEELEGVRESARRRLLSALGAMP